MCCSALPEDEYDEGDEEELEHWWKSGGLSLLETQMHKEKIRDIISLFEDGMVDPTKDPAENSGPMLLTDGSGPVLLVVPFLFDFLCILSLCSLFVTCFAAVALCLNKSVAALGASLSWPHQCFLQAKDTP